MNENDPQIMDLMADGMPASHAVPTHLLPEAPIRINRVAPDTYLVDFGRVAFGNLRLTPPANATGEITIHFGEAFAGGRINRQPPGTVRYATTKIMLVAATPLVAAPPADARNTQQPAAVLTPAEWGVVLPFRWVEIEGWPGELRPEHLRRQAAFASTWDDNAAAFWSSDDLLNRIWELCRYSIKATALHKDADAAAYTSRERTTRAAFQENLFDPARGLYRDGEGTDHSSQHANLFPLAFGLVPAEHRPTLIGVASQDSRHG